MADRRVSQDILSSGGENNIKMLLKTVLHYPHWAFCAGSCFVARKTRSAAARLPPPETTPFGATSV